MVGSLFFYADLWPAFKLMADTIDTILDLLEAQIETGDTSSATDPSQALLLQYISLAIRKIAREEKPQELISATPVSHNITSAQNSVSLDSSLLWPLTVYYKDSSSNYRRVRQKDNVQALIDVVGPTEYFDTSKNGHPAYYAHSGNSLVFDRRFDRTETGAIQVIGLSTTTTYAPSDIGNSTEIQLPIDYNMLIIYEAATLFYQKSEDAEQVSLYSRLADIERSKIRVSFSNSSQSVVMDPEQFTSSVPFSHPSVLWGQGL